MGRGSEIFWFINEKEIPNDTEMQHRYRYISKTDELKKLRAEHQKRLRAEKKGVGNSGTTKDR